MIQILTTLLQPTSGYAIINGYNLLKQARKAKQSMALMLESDMLYYRITGYDNLKFFCKIYKIKNFKEKIHSMAEDFELKKWLNQYVENYSSGMKMKLALCRTLLLEREIIFLDEPTVGLDVKSISWIIDKLKETNKTIFLTSHDMGVVDKLCNRIAFLNKGEIIKIGTKEDIVNAMQKEIVIEIKITESVTQLKKELNQQEYIKNITDNENGIFIKLKNREYYNKLFFILSKYKIRSIKEQELSLEDLFIKLM